VALADGGPLATEASGARVMVEVKLGRVEVEVIVVLVVVKVEVGIVVVNKVVDGQNGWLTSFAHSLKSVRGSSQGFPPKRSRIWTRVRS